MLETIQLDDTDEAYWVGRSGNDLVLGTAALESFVGRLDGDRVTLESSVHAFVVQHIFEDEDGSFWLSTDEGVLRLMRAPFEPLRLADERLSRYLVSYAQTADGAIYACDRRRVYRLARHVRGLTAEPLLRGSAAFFSPCGPTGASCGRSTRAACWSSTATGSSVAFASRAPTPRTSSATPSPDSG